MGKDCSYNPIAFPPSLAVIPDQQKTLSGMTGYFFDFHVSQASMHPSGLYQ